MQFLKNSVFADCLGTSPAAENQRYGFIAGYYNKNTQLN
ncbi:hypothetical protein B194_5251 [Serratia plymuthica A30]|jgi:hypothetical protein|nr:hypothetical protein B194_5251 [Serratia plymuthica A30]